MAKFNGIPLESCPTCFDTGSYRYKGAEHECDCSIQMLLRKHYLLANIPDQYMRLNFWDDFEGSEEVSEWVGRYLDEWPSFKVNGMGLEFFSKGLATGKTFAATHIAKELVKRGERVYFAVFREILSAYEEEKVNGLETRLRNTSVLVLDEVIPPWSEAQSQYFAHKLEELCRHRTNFNLPTIITTNLNPEEIEEHYPRVYSLLEAKQVRFQLYGNDKRQSRIATENLELAANGEVRPIT